LRFISTDEGYCYWDEYIVNDGFEDNDFKDVERVAKAAASKPRYLPSKEEFLRYADDAYYEITPQMLALKEFIEKQLHYADDDIYIILLEIHRLCSEEAKMQPIMDVLNKRDICFDTTEQATVFTNLIMELMNNTRLWLNNGHTPNEVAEKMEKPHLKPLPSQVKQEPRRSTKIGRNEPCPCGSGKKYKKCCIG
jgi:hypothetical protein